jgi:hypothetical protein
MRIVLKKKKKNPEFLFFRKKYPEFLFLLKKNIYLFVDIIVFFFQVVPIWYYALLPILETLL